MSLRFFKGLTLGLYVLLVRTVSAAPAFDSVSPRTAFDINPDPDIVEVVLVAHERMVNFGPGQRATTVWTYNGGIPGPTLRGKIGDTLIVHFYNDLPEETTIHWHGLDVPANMDGSNISQQAVPSGGYYRYEFKLLNPTTAWYHPHIRTNVQVEKGLYGALIVDDTAQEAGLGLPENDHILVLDDILLDPDGRVAEPFPTDPVENAETQLNGREGNVLLVNGRSGRTAVIRRGIPQRLRLVNVSNVRFMRVSIPGHTLYRIGGDGGLLEAPLAIEPIGLVSEHYYAHNCAGHGQEDGDLSMEPEFSDCDPSRGILLTPGERADVVFTPHGKGPLPLEWHDVARGRHHVIDTGSGLALEHAHDDGKRPPQTLLTFRLLGRDTPDDYEPPADLREIAEIDTTGARVLTSIFGHSLPNADGDVTFFVQARMENGTMIPLPWQAVTPELAHTVTIGDTGIWEVHNLTGGMHNFHSHGFQFQLIETQFVDMDTPENNYVVPAPYTEIKDTILLPARPGAAMRSRTITRLAVKFDDTGREGLAAAGGKEPGEDTSGGWVYHCHILEHSARGMISFFQVLNPTAPD